MDMRPRAPGPDPAGQRRADYPMRAAPPQPRREPPPARGQSRSAPRAPSPAGRQTSPPRGVQTRQGAGGQRPVNVNTYTQNGQRAGARRPQTPPDAQGRRQTAPPRSPQQRTAPNTRQRPPQAQRPASPQGAQGARQRPPQAAQGQRPRPPEGARRQPAPKKRPLTPQQQRQRRRRRALITGAVATVVLLIALFVSANVFFKIETIEVKAPEGDLAYSESQILAAFGHSAGENLFGFSTQDAQTKIVTELPYLEDVKVERHLPDTVTITATPAVEESVIESSYGWVVLSKKDKVLRLESEPPEGLVCVTGARADTPLPGQPVKLTEEDKLPILQSLLEKSAAQGLWPITEIDMTSTLEISMLYQGRIRIVIGTQHDMDYKLDWAWRMVTPGQTADSLGENESGTLDVSSRGEDGLGRARWRAGSL